jgi:hypothetical protein
MSQHTLLKRHRHVIRGRIRPGRREQLRLEFGEIHFSQLF